MGFLQGGREYERGRHMRGREGGRGRFYKKGDLYRQREGQREGWRDGWRKEGGGRRSL